MVDVFSVSPIQWISDSLPTIERITLTGNNRMRPINPVDTVPFCDYFTVLQPHNDFLNCNRSIPSRKSIVVFKFLTESNRLFTSAGYSRDYIHTFVKSMEIYKKFLTKFAILSKN